MQEIYLQALRGWHTFHAGADPKRWLFAVCHHALLRTAGRDARYVGAPDDEPELESLATAAAHSRAQRAGVADAAERMDLGPAIDRALATVPAHYRSAVVLVDVEGQRYEEAALVLGVAVGTVRSRPFRGRRLLQDLLFEYARDAGLRRRARPRRPHRAPDSPMTPPDARTAPGTRVVTAGPIDCETAVRRLWDYLDGRLPAGAHDEVEAHLAVCAVCPPHYAFARAIRDALAASAAPVADAEEARLRERVLRALRRHAVERDPVDDGVR